MFFRLLLLLTVVPAVELTLLVWLALETSLQITLLLVLLTGVVGAWLARREGLRCWQRVQDQLAAGQLPGDPLMDGLMILVAGALLITPGMLTDLLGFALLVPAFRKLVKSYLKTRFQAQIEISSPPHGWPAATDQPPARDQIIDTRVVDAPPEEQDPRR